MTERYEKSPVKRPGFLNGAKSMGRPPGRRGPRKSLRSRILWGSEEQQNERAVIFEKNRRKRYDACDELVGQAGFEPATNRL